jgi:hypothetical protein
MRGVWSWIRTLTSRYSQDADFREVAQVLRGGLREVFLPVKSPLRTRTMMMYIDQRLSAVKVPSRPLITDTHLHHRRARMTTRKVVMQMRAAAIANRRLAVRLPPDSVLQLEEVEVLL